MRAHRGEEHFGRQGHELGVDRAGQHDRPFDETGHLVEQAGIGFDHDPQLGGTAVELGGDQLAAPLVVEHDMGVLQLFAIFGDIVGADRARRQKAVAAGRRRPARRRAPMARSAPSKRQTIELSGRTQRSAPPGQRIDFGHGNSAIADLTSSGSTSAVGRPDRLMIAK